MMTFLNRSRKDTRLLPRVLVIFIVLLMIAQTVTPITAVAATVTGVIQASFSKFDDEDEKCYIVSVPNDASEVSIMLSDYLFDKLNNWFFQNLVVSLIP